MGIQREAYQALESIVGPEYISDDPVICSSYVNGGELSYTLFEKCVTAPGCVVLPANTKEVQKIVKVCNRYRIPFVPTSSFWGVESGAKSKEFVTIDLKRMNRLEIDETASELWLYDDAGTTVIKKWPLTDRDDAGVALQGTGPVNRKKRTL